MSEVSKPLDCGSCEDTIQMLTIFLDAILNKMLDANSVRASAWGTNTSYSLKLGRGLNVAAWSCREKITYFFEQHLRV